MSSGALGARTSSSRERIGQVCGFGRSSGLTLIELLIVIGITMGLLGLLLPVVHGIRESANRLSCLNNLKQVGLAVRQHHDVYGLFPSNGGWDGKQTIPSPTGERIRVSTTDFTLKRTFHWGVGDPRRSPRNQTGSWLYAILPFLEHRAVFEGPWLEQRATLEAPSWIVPVTIYVCPSRRPALAYSVVPQDEYGAYQGGGWSWGKSDYSGNSLITPGRVVERTRNVRLASVTDGTSHTILAGEKASDPRVQTPTTWYWDEPFFIGGSGSTARNGIEIMPDAVGNNFRKNWGAAHPGGAQFLFVDGSARLIGYETSWQTMSALLTPDGGEVVPDL
jgi:prepilin-type processing-associated H-X9-DG protein